MESITHPTLMPVESGAGLILVRAVVEEQLDGPADIADSGEKRFSDLLSTVRAVAGELVTTFEGLNLTSAKAEFGLQFAVKSGKLVSAFVEAGADCAFKITLEWGGRQEVTNE